MDIHEVDSAKCNYCDRNEEKTVCGVCGYDPLLPAGRRIVRMRKHLGVARKHLANKFNIGTNTLAFYEKTDKMPPDRYRDFLEILRKLADRNSKRKKGVK